MLKGGGIGQQNEDSNVTRQIENEKNYDSIEKRQKKEDEEESRRIEREKAEHKDKAKEES